MSRYILLIFYIIFNCTMAYSSLRPITSVPFRIVGSFIVLDLQINNSTKLNFILDTGVRNTIITELFPEDSVDLVTNQKTVLQGLGSGNEINALISRNNNLQINKKLTLQNKIVYFLENDIFNLSLHTGTKINGILGADFFRDYVVKINYDLRRIYFYQPATYIPEKSYGLMPMTIENQKMFIHLSVLETDESKRWIKMLIDTGAELNAWFQTITNEAIRMPEKSVYGRIGQGLNGEINGYFARVPQLCIAGFCVKQPIVAFPDSMAISDIIQNSDRDGTIGSQLLGRFNIIIDIFNKKFYFKPNLSFKKPFKYNIAGIEIAQTVALLPQVEVINVWKDSPAAKAGIRPGDIIIELNYEKVFQFSIEQIRGYFEQATSSPMHVKIRREMDIVEFEVEMNAKI